MNTTAPESANQFNRISFHVRLNIKVTGIDSQILKQNGQSISFPNQPDPAFFLILRMKSPGPSSKAIK